MPNRCSKEGCRKKLTLVDLSIQCKCGECFCKLHRLPENHDCSFNFKDKDVEKIVKSMECQASKVIQI